MSAPKLTIMIGQAIEKLRELPDNSVHVIVTSPPYYRLRTYHVDGEIGQEKTVQEYVKTIVEVFREARRVLRPDGTLWVNLGDGYATGGNGAKSEKVQRRAYSSGQVEEAWKKPPVGFKHKDLIGAPWRVALAMQDDGWYLRRDIIWHKAACAPESCRDRCTTSHEYVFHFSKRPRYFYDQFAIMEPVSGGAHPRGKGTNPKANLPRNWDTGPGNHRENKGRFNRVKSNPSFQSGVSNGLVAMKNRRSVWRINIEGYKGAHFATFPRALARIPILAGSSEQGCCAACGAPYERIVKKCAPDPVHQRACGGDANGQYNGHATKNFELQGAQNASDMKRRILAGLVRKETVGWKKRCKCETTERVPCTVLDPFGGSGTTGQVALEHGRNCILIDLDPKNVPLIEQRCAVLKMTSHK